MRKTIQDLIDEQEKEIYHCMQLYKNKLEENYVPQPYLAIVNTNINDEPSQRYIRNKVKKCGKYGIKTSVHTATNMEELRETIAHLNLNENVTAIIIQYPFADWVYVPDQQIFDLVKPEKDIDKLNSCWYYNEKPSNLPLTAMCIHDLIMKMLENGMLKEKDKILFHGNGVTTNKRLYLQMFQTGLFDCRIVNSKTPKESARELIHWSHLIVSGVGKKNSLNVDGKYVICPSIIKNEDGSFSSDLIDEKRDRNFTHKVIGGIGKLTTGALLLRAYYFAWRKRFEQDDKIDHIVKKIYN